MHPHKKKHKKKHKPSIFQRNHTLRRLKFEWCEMDFANKMILLIAVVLMFELVSAVFLHEFISISPEDRLTTNAALRSSLGTIIGYITGGMSHTVKEDKPITAPAYVETLEQADEDFDDFDDFEHCEPDVLTIHQARYLRSLIAASICIISVLVIFIAVLTNLMGYSDGLTQLRDLVAITIGFLVTNASHTKKNH